VRRSLHVLVLVTFSNAQSIEAGEKAIAALRCVLDTGTPLCEHSCRPAGMYAGGSNAYRKAARSEG
jgi:hypothetical protein